MSSNSAALFSLGSGWMLPCYYGRGSTKSQIIKKKRRSNPIFFAQKDGFNNSSTSPLPRPFPSAITILARYALLYFFTRHACSVKFILLIKKKRRSNPIFFAQNYEQKWVGCSDGALVDINKLMACRVLENHDNR